MSIRFQFRPRLLSHLKSYQANDLRADLVAGITVGVVALPLAMAFGIASGVRPEQGLITAVVAGFLISALGGSRVQIGGPAGAFVALLYGIAQKYGVANLLIATMMAGGLLFLMGAFKLGGLVRFVPVSVITGFTAGIAVIIALSQLKDFFGLSVEKTGANFFSQLAALVTAMPSVNPSACLIGVSSLLLIAIWPVSYQAQPSRWRRVTAKLPSTLMVLIVWSLVAVWLKLPVETVGSRFGDLPQGLPMPAIPDFDWQTAQHLVSPAIAIAVLCAIESLLCARVADGLIHDRHDPNQELMAQGVANFVVPWFGGIAATGTIARTVTNVRSGARSPIAGMIHALTLLLILLFAAPLAAHIPLAALAAILLWVAYSMADWAEFAKLKQYSNFYRATLLSTFLLTVVFDVIVAVEVGLVLSSLFFIFRVSSLTRVDPIDLAALSPTAQPRRDALRIEAYRVFGSLFFGSVTKIEQLSDPNHPLPDVLILEMHQVINLDTSALDALETLHRALRQRDGRLMIVGLNEQPLSLLQRSHFAEILGTQNLLATLDEALQVVQTKTP